MNRGAIFYAVQARTGRDGAGLAAVAGSGSAQHDLNHNQLARWRREYAQGKYALNEAEGRITAAGMRGRGVRRAGARDSSTGFACKA